MELTEELRSAIDEGVAELDDDIGLSHEIVLQILQDKYPNLNFMVQDKNSNHH